MPLTPSTMTPLGSRAPRFALPDTDARVVELEDFRDAPALLVAFLCNHCPYVKHIERELARFAREYVPRGLAMVAINANDVETHPEDGLDAMRERRADLGYPFPYLLDEDQSVAKAYAAACTPDFFLYDAERRLVYRGQFDASRPGLDLPVTGADLRAAVDAVLAGEPPLPTQRPSLGCNIKWKVGREPAHAGSRR